ncbi:hypothetical protein SERLADRAFT_471447 [Serpula lacrymans var. lacrymans S7.9]|uniref:Uncharacterized protein n=1 Tax=Serpula lacrymans var. lacrymans (strain S7.9) TaxID=578457 RepID=F8P187_SERL9|nr:uncharacterized protein SERLADRAFT_471447 [Serpula lacrymans var. lacrymans S7.9]EGO22918.1 hypothetical protein SERLADRAFT_471447 [Serpula lacrymans var. lacrymans S7.9]
MHSALATRDLTCHTHFFGTDMCHWLNTNVGLAIACIVGIVSVVIFLILTLLTAIRRRTRTPTLRPLLLPVSSSSFPPPPPSQDQGPPQLPPLYTYAAQPQAQAPPYPFVGQGMDQMAERQEFGQVVQGYNPNVQQPPLGDVAYANQIPLWNRGAYAV